MEKQKQCLLHQIEQIHMKKLSLIFFDMDFNHLAFTNGHPNSKEWDKIKRPRGLDEMKKYAVDLSEGLPEATVIDFYDINGKVYFGEITFFHWSGFEKFNPHEWDEKVWLLDYLTN